MNLALDYDGTASEDIFLFLSFAELARARGHKVYIVTMRYESECVQVEGKKPPADPIHPALLKAVDGLICTNRQAKKPCCEAFGINIDVWIDDNPRAINESGAQIWGWTTPEGFVITPNHSTGEVVSHNTTQTS
jgi:hypothetical protein